MIKRIGITVDLATSLFSSGINQNGMYLSMVYKKMGWDPYLISTDDSLVDGRASKEFKTLGIENLKIIGFKESLSMEWDIVVSLGIAITPRIFNHLKKNKPSIKLISYKCGNEFITMSETIIYGAHDKRKHKDTKIQKTQTADAIWYVPQHEETNHDFFGFLNNSNRNVTVVPFIWDPLLVESYQNNSKFPNWEKHNALNIAIMEPNMSLMKNTIIPTVICSRALDDGIKIDGIHSWSTEKLSTNKDLIQLLQKGNIDLLKKFKALPRKPTLEVLKSTDIVLSWQMNNNLNYLYFDVAWVGYPLVHNADLCKDIGYYYKGQDVTGGVNQIKRAITDHNIDCINVMREQIKRYTVNNPELIETYKRLTSNLMDGIFVKQEYDWKTNSTKPI
jgi:hypothetical protein